MHGHRRSDARLGADMGEGGWGALRLCAAVGLTALIISPTPARADAEADVARARELIRSYKSWHPRFTDRLPPGYCELRREARLLILTLEADSAFNPASPQYKAADDLADEESSEHYW
jgi:hypothetical protein